MREPRVYKYEVGVWWLMLERFIEWLRVHNYAEATIKNRYEHLSLFINWCCERGLAEPQDLTFAQLERFQIYASNYRKANSRYLGLETQVQRITSIKVFFRWMLKHKHIFIDPSAELHLPRVRKKLPQSILKLEEVERILQQPNLKTKKGLRDRSIIEVLYSTGIRRAEVANLTLKDLDKERGMIFIRQGKGAKDRVVPIGERAIAFIEVYLEHSRPKLCCSGKDEGFLFINREGKPFAKEGISRMLRQYIDAAGLEILGSCHIFRHTCATLMLENGADIRYIQEMLGHNSLATTQIYTKVFDQKLKEVHSRTHPSAKLLKPILEDKLKIQKPCDSVEQ